MSYSAQIFNNFLPILVHYLRKLACFLEISWKQHLELRLQRELIDRFQKAVKRGNSALQREFFGLY